LQAADLPTGAVLDVYAAYLQPNAGSSSINVGWQSRSFEAPTLVYNGSGPYSVTFELATSNGQNVQFLLQVAFT
jgi:hypothetical protein